MSKKVTAKEAKAMFGLTDAPIENPVIPPSEADVEAKRMADAEQAKKEEEAKKPKVPPTIFENIQHKHVLSDSEVATLSRKSARIKNTLTSAEQELEGIKAQYKAKFQGFEAEIFSLHQKVDSGYEMRPVKAEVRFLPKENTKAYYDSQTGVFLRQEEMTPADFYIPLFPAPTDPNDLTVPIAKSQPELATINPDGVLTNVIVRRSAGPVETVQEATATEITKVSGINVITEEVNF